ncbi:putative glycerol-3-phosphate transporter 5 isoform X2 [Neodiprion virginianus]|uniref:putative glycerol-3-phosphate transporter 5 isoform X2 n=1 Tax=Neodiprion virginianus TaxID=2961670 RepID=UPI001EE6C546|nr:putative glycerol-3-phosphate transporter 5 isoform X2 [Neodiprion virginianus]
MYQVFITGYRLVEVSYTKPYHVYTIEVLQPNSSLRHIVEKRYSEFNTLHRMLKKDTEDTAPFPPKRVRNSQLKVLEQRRSALESYMQKMLRLSSTKQQVLNFLGIENRAQNTNERMNGQVGIGDPKQVRSLTLRHHPILTFQCDPYIQANTTSSLPDIVTNGVLVDSLLPRKLIAACLTVSGGIMLLFGKTDNYDAMVLLLVVSGLFQGLIWPSLCKVFFFWIQDSRLNTFFGLLSLAEYFGSLMANYLAIFLLKKFSWTFVYPPLSTIVIIVALLALLSLYLPWELHIDVPGRNTQNKLSRRTSWMEIWTLPGVSDLSIAVFSLRLVRSGIVFWVPNFFVQKVGYDTYKAQVALSIYNIGHLFGCIGLGWMARKETVLIQSLILLGIGTLGFVIFWLTISWGFLWSINLLAMVGFAIGGPTAALSASFAVSLGELDGWKSGGAVVGVVSGFGGFGEVFERAVVTFVIETYGWNSMFILLTNLLCFSAFLVNRAHFATSNKLMNGRQYVI